MSDDVYTPTLACLKKNGDALNQDLLLSLPAERLRCSLRYLFSKDKKLTYKLNFKLNFKIKKKFLV